MSRPRTILVFGAGPGIGNNTAIQFAFKGLSHIILLARNTQRLTEFDAPSVRSAAPNAKVSTVTLDLANLDSIPGVLKQLDEMTKDEDVEVVFFNAARIKPSEVLGVSVDEIHEDLKVTPHSPLSYFISIDPSDVNIRNYRHQRSPFTSSLNTSSLNLLPSQHLNLHP
jgi:NADP-dependent 3-hydroxy acid dehydrogenase YdfG